MENLDLTKKRWAITLCESGTIHVHWDQETGSADVKRGFVGLAEEFRDVADRLEASVWITEGRAPKRGVKNSLPSFYVSFRKGKGIRAWPYGVRLWGQALPMKAMNTL